MNKIVYSSIALACTLLLPACGFKSLATQADAVSAKPVQVKLVDTKGKPAGTAAITQQAKGVLITIEAAGLTPGKHGFHIHENGKCEPPKFTSAGSHFNPGGAEHGFNNPKGYHGGDLPNLVADASGTAKGEIFVDYVTLAKGKANSLLKPGGTSIVIHAGEDDYVTNPAGNSGDRVVCGIISE
ncbi:superoxide dismutase family protein [Paenibacillus gansuensis]|uniref:Superoxide dismutase [Cu-Zn] n=1 Tax=Paenibacillus gansuensis TaxID=306542 RepID=A0ABW5PBI3_9BACL